MNKLIALLLCSVMILSGCTNSASPSNTTPLTRNEFVLGTVVTISLYDHQSEDILDKAITKLKDLEDTLSINKSGTLIDKINQQAGISPVKVDEATYSLIEKGLYYCSLSKGAFDITVGPIVKLWNIGFPEARVPSEAEIKKKLPFIGYEKVLLDKQEQTIFLSQKGMLLDLGGIGKGYAADEIARLLKDEGIAHAIINLGGNVYVLGNNPSGEFWKVGVQDPFNPRGEMIGFLKAQNKSIVTSGIYERFVEDHAGHKYHHILDPKTGYPYENDIVSVTIISDLSLDGDALSTTVFSMGLEKGMDFIEGFDGIDAIFVTADKKVYATKTIRENLTLTNSSFKLSSL